MIHNAALTFVLAPEDFEPVWDKYQHYETDVPNEYILQQNLTQKCSYIYNKVFATSNVNIFC